MNVLKAMKVLVLLNAEAGALASAQGSDGADHIRRAFAEHGIDADVQAVPARQLAEAAARGAASDVDAVIAGGGDGTLNTVANVLAGTGKPLGILPLGTHNHFAKDLNMPLAVDDAIAHLARGLALGGIHDLDVAEVNGRVFLNFSGIGFHPAVVRDRDARQKSLGLGKFPALFLAILRVLPRLPLIRVRLSSQSTGLDLRRVTPSVLVCNNEHQMRVFGVENVSRPERCRLNVYVAPRVGPVGLIGLMVRALLHRLNTAKGFDAVCMRDLRIDSRRRRLAVSLDGEVVEMRPPLVYRVREGGLKVVKGNAE